GRDSTHRNPRRAFGSDPGGSFVATIPRRAGADHSKAGGAEVHVRTHDTAPCRVGRVVHRPRKYRRPSGRPAGPLATGADRTVPVDASLPPATHRSAAGIAVAPARPGSGAG